MSNMYIFSYCNTSLHLNRYSALALFFTPNTCQLGCFPYKCISESCWECWCMSSSSFPLEAAINEMKVSHWNDCISSPFASNETAQLPLLTWWLNNACVGWLFPRNLDAHTLMHTHTLTHTQRLAAIMMMTFIGRKRMRPACRLPFAVCQLPQADCILSTCLLGEAVAGAKSLAIIVIIDAVKYVCSHYLGTVWPRDAIVQMEH